MVGLAAEAGGLPASGSISQPSDQECECGELRPAAATARANTDLLYRPPAVAQPVMAVALDRGKDAVGGGTSSHGARSATSAFTVES